MATATGEATSVRLFIVCQFACGIITVHTIQVSPASATSSSSSTKGI